MIPVSRCQKIVLEQRPALETLLTASEESTKVVLSALDMSAQRLEVRWLDSIYLYSAVILPRSAGWASSVIRRGEPRPEKPEPMPTGLISVSPMQILPLV